MIPPTINKVTYAIRLASCSDFRRNTLSLREAIGGEIDGD